MLLAWVSPTLSWLGQVARRDGSRSTEAEDGEADLDWQPMATMLRQASKATGVPFGDWREVGYLPAGAGEFRFAPAGGNPAAVVLDVSCGAGFWTWRASSVDGSLDAAGSFEEEDASLDGLPS